MQSASRDPVVGAAALSVLDGVGTLLVARGKRVVEVDLEAERPSDDELLALLLGRSGKLRAPAIRSGTRLLVGYNPEMIATLVE